MARPACTRCPVQRPPADLQLTLLPGIVARRVKHWHCQGRQSLANSPCGHTLSRHGPASPALCASLMGPDLPAPADSPGGAAASIPPGGPVGTSGEPGGKSPTAPDAAEPSAKAAVCWAEPSATASAFCPCCSSARPPGRASQKASSAALPQMAAAAAMRAVKLRTSLCHQPYHFRVCSRFIQGAVCLHTCDCANACASSEN